MSSTESSTSTISTSVGSAALPAIPTEELGAAVAVPLPTSPDGDIESKVFQSEEKHNTEPPQSESTTTTGGHTNESSNGPNTEPHSEEKGDIMSDGIRVSDNDDKYLVLHYVSCDEKSPDSVKETRGIIRRRDGKIVCKTFGFTPEYVAGTSQALEQVQSIWNQEKRIVVSPEGTLIRVWFDADQWHVSSHKKINADSSRWGGSESHGEIFRKALTRYINEHNDQFNIHEDPVYDAYTATLHQDRVYCFIIGPTKNNRIVSLCSDVADIWFAGEFDNEFKLIQANTSGIAPPALVSVETPEALIQYVQSLSPQNAQGVMLYCHNANTVQCIKIINPAYQILADLRGNCPSVNFRYLQIRAEQDHAKLQCYMALYQEHIPTFAEYERLLANACGQIYDGYVDRYINHRFVVLPQELWFITKDLHDLYLQDPVNYKINEALVANYVYSLPAVRLNTIVQRAKEREAEAANNPSIPIIQPSN